MIAKIKLNIGFMAIATSAKGMSAYISLGLNKKHNIPITINKQSTPDTIKLIASFSFLLMSLPSLEIITEQKKVFCVAYINVKNGSGKIFVIPKSTVKLPEENEQKTLSNKQSIIKGTIKLLKELSLLNEEFNKSIVTIIAIIK